MRADPHSYADLDQGRTEALHLRWEVDLAARRLRGEAELVFDGPHRGPLDLDTRDLEVHEITDHDGRPLPFAWGPTDPVLGQRLRIERPHPVQRVRIRYATSPTASGLMWLDGAQTASGKPFVLSQCQAIHARSLVPLQDTPRARIRYEALVLPPEGLTAVMSAAPGQARDGGLFFTMPQPIPPYLLALAVGDLASHDLGPRTRVFAEPQVIEAAAWEFADAEAMLSAAEALFGPYQWDRYDFVVLPPSFPLGGMENPRMTFLTPTLLAGDRSLVNVLAHELAHSWTGNLVTNADNEHFWLNEGWTVYAERRILEVLEGPQVAAQAAALARRRLDDTIDERSAQGKSTALTYPQEGLDPDAEFSVVPYEKGFLLLLALERAVGRERFDAFLQRYIEAFAFDTVTTDQFVAFLDEHLPDHGVSLPAWLFADGLPDDAPTFATPTLDRLAREAAAWNEGARPRPTTTVETLHVLDHLPPLDADRAAAVADHLGLSGTRNQELRSAWLRRALASGLTVDEEVEAFVAQVGRTKLVLPLFKAMVAAGRRQQAAALYSRHQARWHVSTRQALKSVLDKSDPSSTAST